MIDYEKLDANNQLMTVNLNLAPIYFPVTAFKTLIDAISLSSKAFPISSSSLTYLGIETMSDTTKQTKPSKLAFWKTRSGKNAVAILAIIILYPFIHSYLIKHANNGPAPDFSGIFFNGERFQLQDFAGKPVLIHFWATWCEICAHEMPDIEKLAQKYQVINIAIQSGSNSEVARHAKSNGMNSNIIINDSSKQLETLYNARAVPASFVVNSQGEITYSKHGYSTYSQLSEELNQADK